MWILETILKKGTWKFESNKEMFETSMDLGGQSNLVTSYKILILKNKEIKVEYTDIFDQKRIEIYEQ